MKQWFGARLAVLTVTLVALLPIGAAAAQQGDLLNQVDPGAGFTSVWRTYPKMDARYVRGGTRRNVAQVRSISVGEPREGVQAALGRPAVDHGDGSFEYHLSLPLTGRDRLICQYRVFFDGEDKLTHAIWRRPQCADLVLGRLD